jgi:phosphoserine phosphatase RsbU/P
MNDVNLSQFRQALRQHRDALLEWLETDSPEKANNLGGVEIDDVLQVVSQIKTSLEQINHGQFGVCRKCSGEVEVERLECDFTTNVCLDHYSDEQIRALESDLELAAKVQKGLLPCCMPVIPGVQIAAQTVSARIVSGDYYDFFASRNNAQGIVLADVMGKGLPASMLMSNLQASLRILGPEHETLHGLAERLNELFRYNLKLIKFISVFLAILEKDTHTLRYCNAGHHPALWYEARTGATHWLTPTGPAIGLVQNPNYKSAEIQYHSGDVIVLYTDGLVEARDDRGDELGENRLVEFIDKNHHLTAEACLSSLLETVKGLSGKLHDDVTVMVIKIE